MKTSVEPSRKMRPVRGIAKKEIFHFVHKAFAFRLERGVQNGKEKGLTLPMDLLSGASFQRLEGAIQAASLRQRTLANNVANVDVPNFKRSDVVFEEVLARTMGRTDGPFLRLKRTDPRHLPAVSARGVDPQVVTDETTALNNNRNNVDIEKEMTMMAENQLRYNLFIQQVNHEVKMMRTAITGGR